jgi:hypothetical protein
MDWLEQELRQALARKQPGPGFAGRVSRIAVRRATRVPRLAATAAALLITVASSSFAYREHQGRVAKEHVMTAMRITAMKLNHIQARVKEVRP